MGWAFAFWMSEHIEKLEAFAQTLEGEEKTQVETDVATLKDIEAKAKSESETHEERNIAQEIRNKYKI